MKCILNMEKSLRGNRRIRVLIADDAAIMRDVLSYFVAASHGLELAGCARDGQEAVEVAR